MKPIALEEAFWYDKLSTGGTPDAHIPVKAEVIADWRRLADFTESKADDPLRPLVQNASPIGSRMGSIDDIADAVEFFTGKLARWISGQRLLVSGGAPI